MVIKLKPPNWLDKAMGKMGLNANLIDVIEYIKPRQWLHKGAPFKQRLYSLKVCVEFS